MRMFCRTRNPFVHGAAVTYPSHKENYIGPLIAFVVHIRIKHKWNLSFMPTKVLRLVLDSSMWLGFTTGSLTYLSVSRDKL